MSIVKYYLKLLQHAFLKKEREHPTGTIIPQSVLLNSTGKYYIHENLYIILLEFEMREILESNPEIMCKIIFRAIGKYYFISVLTEVGFYYLFEEEVEDGSDIDEAYDKINSLDYKVIAEVGFYYLCSVLLFFGPQEMMNYLRLLFDW